MVIGVQERDPHGSTIYNTTLYFGPDGRLLNKHRKLVPTGSERTVWGQGDGSTLEVVPTTLGRLGGLICWENYMPLARFHLYAQGVDVWLAPTLARGDGWIATMQHIAREGRLWVVGVNPVLRRDQIPTERRTGCICTSYGSSRTRRVRSAQPRSSSSRPAARRASRRRGATARTRAPPRNRRAARPHLGLRLLVRMWRNR